jgi:hypothetical protein
MPQAGTVIAGHSGEKTRVPAFQGYKYEHKNWQKRSPVSSRVIDGDIRHL